MYRFYTFVCFKNATRFYKAFTLIVIFPLGIRLTTMIDKNLYSHFEQFLSGLLVVGINLAVGIATTYVICALTLRTYFKKRRKEQDQIHWSEKAYHYFGFYNKILVIVVFQAFIHSASDGFAFFPGLPLYQNILVRLGFVFAIYIGLINLYKKTIQSWFKTNISIVSPIFAALFFPSHILVLWVMMEQASQTSLWISMVFMLFAMSPYYFPLIARIIGLESFSDKIIDQIRVIIPNSLHDVKFYTYKRGPFNAFVVPSQRAVMISRKAVEAFSNEELKGVLLHELGHIFVPKKYLYTRYLFALSPFVLTLGYSFLGQFEDYLSPHTFFLIIYLASVFVHARFFGLAEEKKADQYSIASLTDEKDYAHALLKLHQTNLIPAVLGRGKSHPDLYDRMIAANLIPDFPRPKPAKIGIITAIFTGFLIAILNFAALEIGSFTTLGYLLRPNRFETLAERGLNLQEIDPSKAKEFFENSLMFTPTDRLWVVQNCSRLVHADQCKLVQYAVNYARDQGTGISNDSCIESCEVHN